MSGTKRQTAPRAVDDPVESIDGDPGAGVLFLCDHASNALPAEFGDLGLPETAFRRHIAYDIGAAWVTRRLAATFGAPALLTTFSRLLIDPNRGGDDPTLVMRYSDGAIIPGNARLGEAEIEARRRRFWRPYRDAIHARIAEMTEIGPPPAIVSIHSFTPVWRGRPRSWKVGALWDLDPRLPQALMEGCRRFGLTPEEIGDNEPYDGALVGDTIDDCATPLGLSNVLVELRQDLIATESEAWAWADRLRAILEGPLRDPAIAAPQAFGSRAQGKVRRP